MIVVVVAYYATWSSSVGSRRVAAIIDGLHAEGHQVTVIAARSPDGLSSTFNSDVDVVELDPRDRVLRIRSLAAGRHRGTAEATPARAASPASAGRLASALRPWISFPDSMWEWNRLARTSASTLRRPDLVIASAPPMAVLRAASKMAEHWACPWIADLRDLWSDDPYRAVPPVLRSIDRRLERQSVRSAAALVTVAEPLAQRLRARYPGHVVHTIRNGFDPTWLRLGDDPPATPPRLVFTGSAGSGSGRDFTPVLRALADSRDAGLDVYGRTTPALEEQIETESMADVVHIHGSVPATEAREAQHRATALLSLGWNDPRDNGSCPAKLFEYAAARRPIVHVGSTDTVGAAMIRDHQLGFVIDPSDGEQLGRLIDAATAGRLEWTVPTVAALEPLSHRSMVTDFLDVVHAVGGTQPVS